MSVFYVPCAVLTLFSSNCSDSQEVQPIDKLGARLVAYDEDGAEKTVLEANTNIIFMLCIFNNSADDIYDGALYRYCNVYEDEGFLLISKLVRDDNGEEKWKPYGKPYRPPIYCPAMNAPLIVPAEGEVKLHGAQWNNNPDNPPLSAGKYYTAFSFTLELNGQSRTHDLKLEFEV